MATSTSTCQPSNRHIALINRADRQGATILYWFQSSKVTSITSAPRLARAIEVPFGMPGCAEIPQWLREDLDRLDLSREMNRRKRVVVRLVFHSAHMPSHFQHDGVDHAISVLLSGSSPRWLPRVAWRKRCESLQPQAQTAMGGQIPPTGSGAELAHSRSKGSSLVRVVFALPTFRQACFALPPTRMQSAPAKDSAQASQVPILPFIVASIVRSAFGIKAD